MNSTWHYSVSIGYRFKSFLKAIFYILALNAASKILSGEVLYAGNFFILMLTGIILMIKYAYQVEFKNDCIKTRYGVITSQLLNLTQVVKFTETPTSITLCYADNARFTIWIKRLPASATKRIKEQLKLRNIPIEQSLVIEPSSPIAHSLNTAALSVEKEDAAIDKQPNKRVGRNLQKASILLGLMLLLNSVLALVSHGIFVPLEQGFIHRDVNEYAFYIAWAICSVLGSVSVCFGFYLVIKNSDNA